MAEGKLVGIAGMVLLAGAALAEDLTWTGAASSVWDATAIQRRLWKVKQTERAKTECTS